MPTERTLGMTRKGTDEIDQPRGAGTGKGENYIVYLSGTNVEGERVVRSRAVCASGFVVRSTLRW